MINYAAFSALKISNYFKEYEDHSDAASWEWMDNLWYRQSVGFTWFGCHETEQGKTGALELLFEEIDAKTLNRIFSDICLPLKPKMTKSDIEAKIGKPVKQKQFVKDRVTCK